MVAQAVWLAAALGPQGPALALASRPICSYGSQSGMAPALRAGTEEVEPRTEPLLSPSQAAVRGGDCGRNMRLVVRHRLEVPQLAAPRESAPLVGTAAPGVPVWAGRRRVRSRPSQMLDQSKAFERVGWQWLDMVALGWELPDRLRHALSAPYRGRAVPHAHGRRALPARSLR